jgi:hypothetical protein
MALVVKKPVYTKVTMPTGASEPVHTFGLESPWTVSGLSSGTQTPAEVLLATISKESAALNSFLTEFLRLTAAHFAKPYTVANVLKTLKHVVDSTATGSLQFQPRSVQITARGFQIQWSCLAEEVTLISLPDEDDEGDDIPLSDTNEVIQLQTQNHNQTTDIRHVYDRQRVKEATLRAKLAQYKANRAHLEYVEKYGTDPSDSEDSESEESDDSQ